MKRYGHIVGVQRHVGGWKRARYTERRRLMTEYPASAFIADKTDLRAFMPPVFDQENIGSCVDNAGDVLLMFLQGRDVTIDGKLPPNFSFKVLSRLYPYFYARQLEGTPPSEDSGSEVGSFVTVAETRGVPYEEVWPYGEPMFRYNIQPPPEADVEASLHKALLSFKLPSVRSIRASLTQGFPVMFGFVVFENFMSEECAKLGICYMPALGEQSEGGHCVAAVGHDDSKLIGNSKGAFLCQNSWGTSWGRDGFFYLPYDYFEHGFADDPHTIRREMP